MTQAAFDTLRAVSHGERLRLAIIGLGFGARVHLPAFLSIPGVCVVGVADSGSGRAREVIADLGLDIRAWDSWKGAVEAAGVDAISVATPPYVQAEIVRAALRAGKHVLCEKPFGMNAEEAVLMCEQAQDARLVGVVDFEFRMEPGIAETRRLVASGRIGAVRRVRVIWLTRGGADPSIRWSWRHDAQLGGGVLNTFASHVVDYVEWICDSRIYCVSARCEVLVKERTDSRGRTRSVTAEDHCELACDMENGAVAEVAVSNCSSSDPVHRIEVDGDAGRLIFVHEPPFTPDEAILQLETDGEGCRVVPVESLSAAEGFDTRIPLFHRLATRFIQAASGSQVGDLPEFASGLRVQKVLDAARGSSARGVPVDVVENQAVRAGAAALDPRIRSAGR